MRNPIANLILRVRPQAQAAEMIARLGSRRVLGWYSRKALLPLIRGTFASLYFGRVGFPLFLGRDTRLSYRRCIRLGRGVSIGDGVRILALSTDGVRISDSVTIRENGWIQCSSTPLNPGAGLEIGEGTYIGPGVVIGVGGEVRIGQGCQLGAGVTLIAENHSVAESGVSATDVIRQGIELGDRVWIGHRATVLDGVVLGDRCVVGAGAVVTRSFPPGSVVVGVPARSIRQT